MTVSLNGKVIQELKGAGVSDNGLDLISVSAKSLEVVEAVGSNAGKLQSDKSPNARLSAEQIQQVAYMAKSKEVVEAVADRIEAFEKAGLKSNHIVNILINAKSAEVVHAIADRAENFFTNPELITCIAVSAKLAEVIHAVADRIADLREAKLNDAQITEVAISAKSKAVVDAVLDNPDFYKTSVDIVNVATKATSPDVVKAAAKLRSVLGSDYMVHVAINATSHKVVEAVASRDKEFKAAGLNDKQIADIAINATSADVVKKVADKASDLQIAGLSGDKIVGLATRGEITEKEILDIRTAARAASIDEGKAAASRGKLETLLQPKAPAPAAEVPHKVVERAGQAL